MFWRCDARRSYQRQADSMFSRLLIFLTTILAFIPTAASAWTIGHFKDPMTDRQETYCTVSSGQVSLYVGCMNGRVFPRLNFSQRVGGFDIGATYRFDQGSPVMRIARLSQDGHSLWLWPLDGPSTAAKMRSAKRLRVQIGKELLDFDLASGDRLPEIRCR